MVPLADVQRLALAGAQSLPPVPMALDDALGCVLAADVLACEDVPPFANSAMDGYAVRAVDTARAPVELDVIGSVGAGAVSVAGIGPGEAIQIMTGAPIPAGADGIAIVERTEAIAAPDAGAGDAALPRVRILDVISRREHVRPAGSDLAAGAVAVAAGTLLPAHIGVLASVGAGVVTVHPRPRVGVMTTGDELVELAPDGSARPLAPGQIRDSNRHAMLATLRRDGFAPIDLGVIGDTEQAVTAGLTRAISTCDAVLTTGGVSKGAFDYVKVVLARLAAAAASVPGVVAHELSVAIRPAKPLVIAWLPAGADPVGDQKPSGSRGASSEDGILAGEHAEAASRRLVPVFGLPGNPVSSLVSYQAIALPVLQVLAGHAPAPPPTFPAVAREDMRRRPDGKTHLLRVDVSWQADGRLGARLAGGQMSHQLTGMAAANALAIIADGEGLAAGEMLEVIPFGPILSERPS